MTRLGKLLNGESQTITSAAMLIGIASLLSRVLGVLRERLLVSHFGVGDSLDAYYASFEAPNFLYNLLILGTGVRINGSVKNISTVVIAGPGVRITGSMTGIGTLYYLPGATLTVGGSTQVGQTIHL